MPTASLPPQPSLEQLRNQAKDLLKAHKSGDPEIAPRLREYLARFSAASDAEVLRAKVSLRDAQIVVAREHGFADWRELKASVGPSAVGKVIDVTPTVKFLGFDLHAATGRISLSRAVYREAELTATISDLRSGEQLGTIPKRFHPQDPRFSPEGNQLASGGHGRIYVHSISEGTTNTVVDTPGSEPRWPSWSPDGGTLAFQAAPLTEDPVGSSSIFTVDLREGVVVRLTPEAANVVDLAPVWSPSGRLLAFERRFIEGAEQTGSAVVMESDGSSPVAMPTEEGGRQKVGHGSFSADETHMLVAEFGSWYGKGAHRLKLFRLSDLEVVWETQDDKIRNGCFDPYNPRFLCVSEESLTLYEYPSGRRSHELDLSDFAPVEITYPGPAVAFDADGKSLYFLGANGHLYRWRVGGGCESVMEVEREAPFQLRRDEYRFAARDGLEIPVHRYLPSRPNGSAIVYVDGGPGSTMRPDDDIAMRLLDEGYEVVRPAYRGTRGFGDEHYEASGREWGRADVWDVVDCGIDWKRRFDAEDRPLAVGGFSYGGYLTFLALTDPKAPWSCGVTFWGVTHMLGMQTIHGLPKDPESREEAFRERSPVVQAGKIRFPLLILHGGRDTTSTDDQVQSIQKSVRGSGLPCEVVVFDNDTHGLPNSRPEMFRQALGFLDRYSK